MQKIDPEGTRRNQEGTRRNQKDPEEPRRTKQDPERPGRLVKQLFHNQAKEWSKIMYDDVSGSP